MKKIFKFISCFIVISMLFNPLIVNAASGSYSISSSSSVEVGNTISVKFTIKASKLFYWQAYITYDTSKLQLVSGSTNFQGESDNASVGQSSVTKTLKFKAKKTGSAWVAIAMGNKENNINADIQEVSFKKATKTINITEKKVVTYSSNNNLKSLSIDGYKLSPEFNKNTLQYSVELPANTTQIKINVTKEDKTSTVSGIGTQKVSEGANKLTIKVTAENGNIKNYVINATVKELDPIEVTIDKKKYTVIRKKEQLPKASSTYSETTTKINEQEVPALKSEITNYTLVGLKDEEGNIGLYICDENSYKLYQEITFNKLTIVPLDASTNIEIPKGYKQTTMKINDKDTIVFEKQGNYPIFVGLNIETGKSNLYTYDKDENTIQRFNNSSPEEPIRLTTSLANSNTNVYTYTIIFLGTSLLITYFVILINLIQKNKKPKKIGLK